MTNLQQLAPNLKAINRFDDVERRLLSTIEDFESARDNAMQAVQAFNEVRQERFECFMQAYRHVEANIDDIYKSLTSSSSHPGGTAYLTLENPEEPYLHGIKYNAMPPRKRFSDMDQLSGGEKTVAALALLFAIHG
jgi:structural maintenance of chromosome 1